MWLATVRDEFENPWPDEPQIKFEVYEEVVVEEDGEPCKALNMFTAPTIILLPNLRPKVGSERVSFMLRFPRLLAIFNGLPFNPGSGWQDDQISMLQIGT